MTRLRYGRYHCVDIGSYSRCLFDYRAGNGE